MKIFVNTLFALLVSVLVLGAASAQSGNIVVQTVAEKEEVFTDQSGQETTRLVPVATVVPGDEVIYTVSFTNVGDAAVENVVITDPVPDHMSYVDRSAFGPGTDITFSVDAGNSYAAPDRLTVTESDGEERAARADDYTHIRWVMRNALQPGKKGFARFRCRLR